jgi:thiosulfate dehydrogenase
MGFDPVRGKIVYEQNCTVCHGDNGQGVVNLGFTQFPPLWGDKSYNWGAGMHKVNIAAKFIKANMPLGKPNSLSDQDAWDVAAFINSQQRPQDPRHQGNLAETTKKFHASKYDYYGQVYGLSADKPQNKEKK